MAAWFARFGGWCHRHRSGTAVVVLLCLQAALLAWMSWTTSITRTEVGHFGAAAYFRSTYRFDVFRVNPPLTRMVCAVPAGAFPNGVRGGEYSSDPRVHSEWALGQALIEQGSLGSVRRRVFLARCVLIPFLLLGGYVGYRWSRDLSGRAAALVFLALWCTSPLVLAMGAMLSPDATAAALGLAGVFTLRQWLREPGWGRAACAGVCLGLLPLAKLTWVIAFALWPLLWCAWTLPLLRAPRAAGRLTPAPFRQLVLMVCLGVCTLNAGYLFDGTFRPLGRYGFFSNLLGGGTAATTEQMPPARNRFTGTWLAKIPVPLPAEFVRGIDVQRVDDEHGLRYYLRGRWAGHGWWYYYLYLLALKEPLGTWCLVALAAGLTIFGRGYAASWREEMLVLAPFAVLLAFVSSQTGLSLHSRYVLPAWPFLLVWTSRVGRTFEGRPFTRGRLSLAGSVAVALAWSVASSLFIYPHSLSYFNELAVVVPTPGQPCSPPPTGDGTPRPAVLAALGRAIDAGPLNGPRHLLHSNIDWGQDLFDLEAWCMAHPEARPLRVAYFGGYPLGRTRIVSIGEPPPGPGGAQAAGATDPAAAGPLPGWYALSVNDIYGEPPRYRYFLRFAPVAMAGYSIYIYHLTPGEVGPVRQALGLPPVPGR